jgi:hypothetical protein
MNLDDGCMRSVENSLEDFLYRQEYVHIEHLLLQMISPYAQWVTRIYRKSSAIHQRVTRNPYVGVVATAKDVAEQQWQQATTTTRE